MGQIWADEMQAELASQPAGERDRTARLLISVGDFGSEGRTTYSAIGTQTNLTARIQDKCEPGRVLISHATWALVHEEIPCESRGEVEVKGLHFPIKVYEVLDEQPVSTTG